MRSFALTIYGLKRGVYRAEREADSAARTCRQSVIYKEKLAYAGFYKSEYFLALAKLGFWAYVDFSSDPTHSFINETPGVAGKLCE